MTYYASLMDQDDPNCAIRLQSVPQLGELTIYPEDLEDPLNEEGDMPTPCITHRYPDRVLFYVTHKMQLIELPPFDLLHKHLQESPQLCLLRYRQNN